MPTRLCLYSTCPNTATFRGRCKQHASQHYTRRVQPAKRQVYDTKRWQLTRAKVLAQQPLCAVCGALAQHVHHKVDINDGGDPWALDGLEALCPTCHGQLTMTGRAG